MTNLGCLHSPVPVLLFSLSVDVQVELLNEGLGISLIFDGHEDFLEVIVWGQFLVGCTPLLVASYLS